LLAVTEDVGDAVDPTDRDVVVLSDVDDVSDVDNVDVTVAPCDLEAGTEDVEAVVLDAGSSTLELGEGLSVVLVEEDKDGLAAWDGDSDTEAVEVADAPSDLETVVDAVDERVIEIVADIVLDSVAELVSDADRLEEADSDVDAVEVVEGKFEGVLLGLTDLLLVRDGVSVFDDVLDLLEVLLGVLDADADARRRKRPISPSSDNAWPVPGKVSARNLCFV
jgi:hypothetical protein